MPSISNTSKIALSLATALSLSACIEITDVQETETDTTTDPINAPQLTMNLPVTLSGVIATSSGKPSLSGPSVRRAAVTDPSQCEQYFDPHANFMENGYSMTRFLVGLSQQQSCFSDFIINAVVAQAGVWVNQGLITIPSNPDDPEAPTHAQIEQSGDTYQVWLFFAGGSTLPADLSTVQTLYLTWTGDANVATGRFYMANMPEDPNDPDAPEGVRVDFTRGLSTSENKIYLDMRAGHSGGLGGFRIDVTQTGTGDSASYSAKGLVTFLGQPFPNLPAGLDLPEFAAAAVVDADGKGAASASFNNFAVTLDNDKNSNGTIEPVDGEFDLGSYQFNINDTTYFDPALYTATDTQTPFVTQVIEWRNKSVSDAIYVAETPRIETADPTGTGNYTMLKCLEREYCDYNQNGVRDVTDAYTEWEGWNLGAGYFTDTCIDDANAVNNDCNNFVGKLFEQNMFGIAALNSTDPEPTDARNTDLNSIVQLTTVHPDDDTTGATTFDVPVPPTR